MKTGVASAAAVVAGASAAHAADAGFAGHDWSGVYVGASLGVMGGDTPWDEADGYDYKLKSQAAFGGFIGVNHQFHNNMVVGLEAALQSGGGVDSADANNAGDDYNVDHMADVKLKVGTTFGSDNQILAYGFGGLSQMGITAHGNAYSAVGFNFGLGADYAVSDNFTVGAEVIGRSLTGYKSTGARFDEQASLRVAFHF